jgi:3-hydroxyisobutyrate dehydrogenase-like beta-hydroxyacid dehydrogenase
MAAPERVGFIGLGIMGSRMAANARRGGYELAVWNRTEQTAREWAERNGAAVAENPAELGATCDIVVTMVTAGADVEAVLIGPGGVAEGAPPGRLCVDCSTIGPAATRRIATGLARGGLRMIDAPVTGSAPRAADGTLTIMVGGEDGDFAQARPLLETMGALVLHVGPLGHGQLIKLINNAVAAANAVAVGEALLVARSGEVDLDALVAVMEAGSGGSAMLSLKQAPMRAHDFRPLFKLEHMLKDVRLCLEEAGVPFSAAERALADLTWAERSGHGQDDFAALLEAAEHRAGLRL